MGFLVEPVESGDLKSVMRLAWKTSAYPLPYGFFERVAATQAEYFRVVREKGSHRVLAFIIAARREAAPGNLLLLSVHPDHRNRGLRRALLRDVQRVLIGEGEREFALEVGMDDRDLIDFYRREGFAIVGVEPRRRGEATDHLLLSKRLG